MKNINMLRYIVLLFSLLFGKSNISEPAIQFTYHAKQRMIERHISKKTILSTLKAHASIKCSNHSLKYTGKQVTVITDHTSKKIITAYKTNKKRISYSQPKQLREDTSIASLLIRILSLKKGSQPY